MNSPENFYRKKVALPLLAVKRIALPGAVVQMTCATLLGMATSWWWGWPWGHGLLFGLSLSCASTVVLLKALEARGILESMNGRIAVGWLIVEDLATVLVLVLLPPLAALLGGNAVAVSGNEAVWITIAKTLLQVGAFIGLMMIVGRRVWGRPSSRVTSRHLDHGRSSRVFISRSNRPYGLTCSQISGVRAA
jgi:predicted Kef-type K+ transport protein